MSLFSRRRSAPDNVEARTAVHLPSYLFSGPATYANVDTSSADTSLQSVAVHATVDLIASLSSELPVEVYSGEGPDRRRRPTPGYLLDPAGDGHGLQDWAYQVLVSYLLRGNIYGDVLDRRGAYATQVMLHHPDDVTAYVDQSSGEVVWMVGGERVDPATFLHRRVNPMPGRVQGVSSVALHASQIGLTLTTSRFGLQWFQDGAHPGGMLVNEEAALDPDQAKTAKDRFLAAVRGTREPVVLGKGWRYQAIQVSAEESQFLATQKYTEAQCARIFGPGFAEILGYDSGASMTYTNVVDRDVHILKYSLNKWLRRLERLLTEMLPAPQYVCVDRDALLSTATLARYQAHALALKNQWKTVNEIRTAENLPPVDWGDEPNAITGHQSNDVTVPAEQQPAGM